jgi:hypothetical protein
VTVRRTVENEDGDRYLLLKESAESSLVRDPETGETQYLPTAALDPVAGQSPLATAARELPSDVRTLLVAVPDERALGLLLELDADGPLAVRTLLSAYDLCESDLHGLLAELRAAGLLAETTVTGRRGYGTTETASETLATLRDL